MVTSVSCNPSRVIVGFKKAVPLDEYAKSNYPNAEAMAADVLRRDGSSFGYVGVIRRLKYLNAVSVLVVPILVDLFVREVIHIDGVEYCDYDYLIKPCAYETQVDPAHVSQFPIGTILSRWHGASTTGSFGLGGRVALLDTGLSPHPYLPALSLCEGKTREATRHESLAGLAGSALFDDLLLLEHTATDPYTSRADYPRLSDEARARLKDHADRVWSNWKIAVRDWLNNSRRDPRPELPHYRSSVGALRIISRDSWNLLDDTPNVLDLDGHGTAMAGFFAALPPNPDNSLLRKFPILGRTPPVSIPNPNYVDWFDHNLVGMVPFAELVVFKCFDNKNLSSSLIALLDGLSRSVDVKVDVIYIGGEFITAPPGNVNSLTRMLRIVEQDNIFAIAPAGNATPGRAGISTPAGIPGVIAVSAVSEDPRSGLLVKSAESNFADVAAREEIGFCAYGGTPSAPVLTTQRDYGFQSVSGTSVAAAIAAAVFCKAVADKYTIDARTNYDLMVGASGVADIARVRSTVETFQMSSTLKADILKHFQKTASTRFARPFLPPPDHEFGYGCIQAN